MSIVDRLFRIARSKLGEFRHPYQYTSTDIPFQDMNDPQPHQRRQNERQQQRDQHYHQQSKKSAHQDPKLAAYYANLELPYGADLVQVRAAWKRLMRQYHPDRHSQDPEKRKVAEQLTQGLNEAFHALEKHLKHQSGS